MVIKNPSEGQWVVSVRDHPVQYFDNRDAAISWFKNQLPSVYRMYRTLVSEEEQIAIQLNIPTSIGYTSLKIEPALNWGGFFEDSISVPH